MHARPTSRVFGRTGYLRRSHAATCVSHPRRSGRLGHLSEGLSCDAAAYVCGWTGRACWINLGRACVRHVGETVAPQAASHVYFKHAYVRCSTTTASNSSLYPTVPVWEDSPELHTQTLVFEPHACTHANAPQQAYCWKGGNCRSSVSSTEATAALLLWLCGVEFRSELATGMHSHVWGGALAWRVRLRLLLFGTCPPLCVGALWPITAWVWRDVRSGIFCFNGQPNTSAFQAYITFTLMCHQPEGLYPLLASPPLALTTSRE